MSEQWEVGTRNLKTGEEFGFFSGDHASVVKEYEKRTARQNKKKRPDGLNHFYRRATVTVLA